jgi:phosphoribosylaminoimidazole-succinocarboxamide synthase
LTIREAASSDEAVVLQTKLPLDLLRRGKVRDTYRLGDRLLMVASDRISAFDVVMPNGIPRKGEVLTALSRFWFATTAHLVPNHLMAGSDVSNLSAYLPDIARRAMVVRPAERIDVECVVRGYLSGSGWTEYRDRGTLAGEALPAGLVESQRLLEPRFTPAIKNDAGHDENISRARLCAMIGPELAGQLEDLSIRLYEFAAYYALERGIIIADTKFEFGFIGGRLHIIDELLTPDSSRFWPLDRYMPGGPQSSFDKQPVRDFLAASGWNKQPPAPVLPETVVRDTTRRYLEAHRLITGGELEGLS